MLRFPQTGDGFSFSWHGAKKHQPPPLLPVEQGTWAQALSRRALESALPLLPASSAEKAQGMVMPVHAVQPHPHHSAAWHPARFESPRRSASGGAFAAFSLLHRIGQQLFLPFPPFVPAPGSPAPPTRSAAGESCGYGFQSINSTSLGCHYDAQAHAGFVCGLFHVMFLQKGYRKTGMDRTCRFVWKVANYFFRVPSA